MKVTLRKPIGNIHYRHGSLVHLWSTVFGPSRGRRRVVEALRLLREAAFDPEQLEIITAAFDGAWEAIQGRIDNDAERSSARMKLATIILARACAGMMEQEKLKASAIQAMNEVLD